MGWGSHRCLLGLTLRLSWTIRCTNPACWAQGAVQGVGYWLGRQRGDISTARPAVQAPCCLAKGLDGCRRRPLAQPVPAGPALRCVSWSSLPQWSGSIHQPRVVAWLELSEAPYSCTSTRTLHVHRRPRAHAYAQSNSAVKAVHVAQLVQTVSGFVRGVNGVRIY